MCVLPAVALGETERTAAIDVPAGERRPLAMATPDRPVAMASRLAGELTIDGRLDDPAWQAAEVRRGFWQRNPHEGAPPEQDTEFRILYDDDALYVAIRAFDSRPDLVRGLLTRRDEMSPSDWLIIGIDSYFDRRTAFVFGLNPAGVQVDLLAFDDVEEDMSWDAVWTGAAAVDERGWTAEFRIPLSQLRFSGEPVQRWGLQIRRLVGRTNEETLWAPWPKTSSQLVGTFGTLEGIREVRPSRRLELLPYALGGAGLRAADPGDPYSDGLDGLAGFGLDVKYGLSNNATLSATINPDFGQVEADPSEVNLTAGESFFQEKRPFFLEGTDIFRFGLGQGDNTAETLFYTRRIGAAPHDSVSGVGDYHREPASTTIYGAAKLSGKTAGGWSFGLLDAVTAEEVGRARLADGTEVRRPIEPLTNYAVLRVRKDLRGGGSHVGGVITSVHRDLDGTALDWLHDQAYAGGLDASHRFGGGDYLAEAKLSGSYVHGSAAAIDRTQRASQRYYQRPDADHLAYDPTRTSLAGAALQAMVAKMGGTPWRYATGVDTRTPGYEVNDLGFQQSADQYVQWVWLQYRDDQPGDVVRSYQINVNGWGVTDMDPRLINVGGNVNGGATHVSYWSVHAGVGVNGDRWDPNLLRGGPLTRADSSLNSWLSLASDSRKRVRLNLSASLWLRPETASTQTFVGPTVVVQARSNLDLALGPGLSWRDDTNQYVGAVEDALGQTHYLLARIEQRTLSATVRVNYTFSPALTLQLYAQPFVASARYSELKEPSDPRAQDYADRFRTFEPGQVALMDDAYAIDRDGDGIADLTVDRPDFRFRQLRANLVLRWEYRPGSTLFVIWSHDRTSAVTDDARDLGGDLASLAGEPGEHMALVKLNYWLGM